MQAQRSWASFFSEAFHDVAIFLTGLIAGYPLKSSFEKASENYQQHAHLLQPGALPRTRGILKTFVYDTVHTELIGSYIYNKVHAMNVSDNPVMPFHAFRGDNSAITNTITTGDTRPDPRKISPVAWKPESNHTCRFLWYQMS
uniref:Uncharacterized protein n=1 Tax=Klebsiella pneumoniae TaxID=573 RepID=A0A8B0SSN3_KLEPN|nr:hypothetical protein [Klebsiella pneumoniae]